MKDGGQPEGKVAGTAALDYRTQQDCRVAWHCPCTAFCAGCTVHTSAMEHMHGACMEHGADGCAGGEECSSPAVQSPTLGKRKAAATPSATRRRALSGRVVEPTRTRPPSKACILQVEPRRKRAAPQREVLPAKRLRSSAVKKSVITSPAGLAESPTTSQQSGRLLRRATLAPLANGVVPASSAVEIPRSEECKSRTRRLQRAPSHSAPEQAASNRSTGQRRPHEAASARSAEEAARRSAAPQTVSEPASSPDKTAEGPAGATRRARLLQQQVGCAAGPNAATLSSQPSRLRVHSSFCHDLMLTSFMQSRCDLSPLRCRSLDSIQVPGYARCPSPWAGPTPRSTPAHGEDDFAGFGIRPGGARTPGAHQVCPSHDLRHQRRPHRSCCRMVSARSQASCTCLWLQAAHPQVSRSRESGQCSGRGISGRGEVQVSAPQCHSWPPAADATRSTVRRRLCS